MGDATLLNDALLPLKGARNAILFGTKIRLVDGIVKALLYSKGTLTDSIKQVVDVTFEHGSSLAAQVFFHKTLLILLRRIQGQDRPWHAALGGFIAGALIWGRTSRFNEMLNLYLLSRVLLAFARTVEVPPVVSNHSNRAFSALIWAAVMYQFHTKMPLQVTLETTMTYLHHDSMRYGWKSWGPNLGYGARAVPYVAALVWFLKLSGLLTLFLLGLIPENQITISA